MGLSVQFGGYASRSESKVTMSSSIGTKPLR